MAMPNNSHLTYYVNVPTDHFADIYPYPYGTMDIYVASSIRTYLTF